MSEKNNGNGVFIAVRHGDYDERENLTLDGEKQMERVAQKIKELNTAGLPITIICSTAPRAEQGGRIIAEQLNVPKERVLFEKCVWLDNHHYTKFSNVRECVEEHFHGDMILLVISHLDLVPGLASYATEKMHGRKKIFDDSAYGAGWLIDSESFRQFP